VEPETHIFQQEPGSLMPDREHFHVGIGGNGPALLGEGHRRGGGWSQDKLRNRDGQRQG
jgi:hypothetical protein